MEWIDLGNPYPLRVQEHYTPIVWPDIGVVPLPALKIDDLGTKTLAQLLDNRRTRRDFGTLDDERLGAIMGSVCRVQQVGEQVLGFPLSRRPTPSAGAIHSIHVLLIRPDQNAWYRYDPFTHGLQPVETTADPRKVRRAMDDVLPAPEATILLLAAEPGMMAAKYARPESLVWRDAGVLLGFLAIASEALNLSFCPLGVTGEPWVSELLNQPGLVGVGVALVGTTPR